MTIEQIEMAVKDYDDIVKKENANRAEWTKMIEHYEYLLSVSYSKFRPYDLIYKPEYGDRYIFGQTVAKHLRERK